MISKSEPQARDLTPQASVPSTSDLRSLRYIESDEIPGVRPLKTSFGVTISLLKQTIPGRHSSAPKQPGDFAGSHAMVVRGLNLVELFKSAITP